MKCDCACVTPLVLQALFRGSVECRCTGGYHRGVTDPKGAPCSRPPTTPRNVTATKVSDDASIAPLAEGGVPLLTEELLELLELL